MNCKYASTATLAQSRQTSGELLLCFVILQGAVWIRKETPVGSTGRMTKKGKEDKEEEIHVVVHVDL